MAASAADIRSALSIPGPSNLNPKRSQTSNKPPKKPEGIPRELYSLIGPSAPSLAAQLTKPRLKQKPNLGGGGKVKWEWRSFKNSGRTDGLQLNHWVKATTDPNADYPFAKYNTQQTVYSFSQEEYSRLLDDDQWTKEETDYLFQLVREYDLRWYVIYDRYEYPTKIARTLEDLKDRYFSACRKLVRNRPWAGDEAAKAAQLASLSFNKENEVRRKLHIESLDHRTPEQIAEEEALFIELKKLEQTERKFKREREDLLRRLAGIDSGLPDIREDEPVFAPSNNSIETKKRKNRPSTSMEAETPTTPSTSTPIVKRSPTVRNAAYDAQHCIIRTELPPTIPATKAAHSPAYLRSYKIPYAKAAVLPRTTTLLSELKITLSRLVMPTRENIGQYQALLDATQALIETKKVIDRVDQDIESLKKQLGIREGSAAGEGEGMEQDEDSMVGDDGRAQSVLSARSRKQARRSISVSSVDTSATASTRAGNKRQKRS